MTIVECVCCARELRDDEPQTCVVCVGRARSDLQTVMELVEHAEPELDGWPASSGPSSGPRSAERPLPGGDLLVLLSPGSEGRSQLGGGLDWPTAPHAADEQTGDPPSIVSVLADWEDDWRRTRGDPAANTSHRRTLVDAAGYLDRHTSWAAQHHPEFPGYRDALRELRIHLETRLRAGPQRSPVPCITCGRRALERPDPRPDTRPAGDARIVEWECAHCHRRYEPADYWLAVRHSKEPVG